MVAVIVLVAAAGIVAVGSVKGWFTDSEDTLAQAESVSGIVSVQRGGVSFELKSGDSLMTGDVVTTSDKAEVLIKSGDNTYKLSENTEAKLDASDDGSYMMELSTGEAFVVLDDGKNFGEMTAQDNKITSQQAVFSVNLHTGSMGVNVFAGSVKTAAEGDSVTASAGETVSIVGKDMEVVAMTAESLNQFNIENMLETGKTHDLCFSEDELNKILADRAEESAGGKGAEGENQGDVSSDNDGSSQSGDSQKADNPAGSNPGSSSSGSQTGPSSNSSSGTSGAGNSGNSGSAGSGSGGSSSNSGSGQSSSGTKYDYSCTIEIRCDTILNNMDKLTSGKEGYVPSDGAILRKTTVGFNEGETVYDVLQRICKSKGIQLEASWSPIYGSSYVEGINHLYEFDCGPQSGWVYKVNGWCPNYGCSAYKLGNGDAISWLYTCEGLGADVGGSVNR